MSGLIINTRTGRTSCPDCRALREALERQVAASEDTLCHDEACFAWAYQEVLKFLAGEPYEFDGSKL